MPRAEPVISAGLGVLRRGRRQRSLVLLAAAALAVAASVVTGFDPGTALRSLPRALRWLAANLPPEPGTLVRLPSIAARLGETVVMAVTATVLGSAPAMILALLGSGATRPHPSLAVLARGLGSVFRNIPAVAWAIVLLFSFGPGMFAGLLALTCSTFGFLVRAFLETIDEVSTGSVEALRATGARWLQTIVHAVLPGSMPRVLSWILFMVETNVREATLVGYLTGTGIGLSFNLAYSVRNYPLAGLIVVSIAAVVLLVENVSTVARRAML